MRELRGRGRVLEEYGRSEVHEELSGSAIAE